MSNFSGTSIKDALLSVPDGLIRLEEKLWYNLGRCRWHLSDTSLQPCCGRCLRHIKERQKLGIEPKTPVKYLSGSWCLGVSIYRDNFYHTVTDLLPLLLSIKDTKPRLLLNGSPSPAQKVIFSALATETLILDSGWYKVEELRIPSPIFPDWSQEKRKIVTFFFTELFPTDPHQSKSTDLKLYISRKLARRRHLSNEDELLPYLDKQGFTCVYLEALPLKEQINLFRRSSHILTPHGAALTHSMHLPPKARVLEVRPVPQVGEYCFEQLTAGMPITHTVIVPKKTGEFQVSLNELNLVKDFWL